MEDMISRVFLIVALFASTIFAGDTTKITVKVTSLSGKPVDRASVVVRFVEGRSVVKLGKKIITHWELRTNQDGVVRVPSLPQGKIQVQVIAKGYQTYGNVYEVDDDEHTVEIKLNPPQPQYTAH